MGGQARPAIEESLADSRQRREVFFRAETKLFKVAAGLSEFVGKACGDVVDQ